MYFHGVNGTSTHIHLALNIEQPVSISELVKDLKGASSREINQRAGRTVLQWQRGYGVVSFGKRQLAWVLEYIANQKEHHARGTAKRRLEQTGADDGEVD